MKAEFKDGRVKRPSLVCSETLKNESENDFCSRNSAPGRVHIESVVLINNPSAPCTYSVVIQRDVAVSL